MPRIQRPVRPILVDYICDKCGKGSYRHSGTDNMKVLWSNPPKFPHECTECGDRKYFIEKYPTIRYAYEGEVLDLENYEQQPM